MTFKIVGEIPSAMHHIRIRDIATGKEMKLLDILATRWIDFKAVECPQNVHMPFEGEQTGPDLAK